MHSQKPYSNATFTKRVDHEGGRHRTFRPPPHPRRCPHCSAVYVDKHWVSAASLTKQRQKDFADAKPALCPACKLIANGIAGGYVYLEGTFLTNHYEEIARLINKEVDRAMVKNPLNKLVGWEKDSKGRVVITTTTEHLAKRLGLAVEKAFSGEVRYDFSHENKLARVWWRRESDDLPHE